MRFRLNVYALTNFHVRLGYIESRMYIFSGVYTMTVIPNIPTKGARYSKQICADHSK